MIRSTRNRMVGICSDACLQPTLQHSSWMQFADGRVRTHLDVLEHFVVIEHLAGRGHTNSTVANGLIILDTLALAVWSGLCSANEGCQRCLLKEAAWMSLASDSSILTCQCVTPLLTFCPHNPSQPSKKLMSGPRNGPGSRACTKPDPFIIFGVIAK